MVPTPADLYMTISIQAYGIRRDSILKWRIKEPLLYLLLTLHLAERPCMSNQHHSLIRARLNLSAVYLAA